MSFANLLDDDVTPKPAPRGAKRTSRGPLHDILTRGLPDLCTEDEEGTVCNLHELAKLLGISAQAMYGYMGRKQRLPKFRAEQIIQMSKTQKTGGARFRPLQITDIWDYISG